MNPCPKCGKLGMYAWRGSETARACQECGHVEPRDNQGTENAAAEAKRADGHSNPTGLYGA
jgi:DNA-directed RNA polymerase subunit M/transcription elongation factor TFIIS